MNTNSLSLNDLYDIVEPAPVSWWPPAPGWWILFAVAGIAIVFLLIHRLRCRRKNAYRRAALAELGKAESADEVAAILRRTALAAYPRKAIASRHGNEWIEWLETTASIPLPDTAKKSMASVYSNDETHTEPLRDYARAWILQHPAKEGGTC
ncbi:MAG: DUF4381 domain-containing protein [Verrucomicrobiota bacterium]